MNDYSPTVRPRFMDFVSMPDTYIEVAARTVVVSIDKTDNQTHGWIES